MSRFDSKDSGSDEWYTPHYLPDFARFVMGEIDLDPASNEIANETVQASKFYTIEDDGLDLPWNGRIWCNPPWHYGGMMAWVEKLLEEIREGRCTEAFFLTSASTETEWFRTLFHEAQTTILTDHRLQYFNPEKPKNKSNILGSALFYFGSQPHFVEEWAGKFKHKRNKDSVRTYEGFGYVSVKPSASPNGRQWDYTQRQRRGLLWSQETT